MKSIINVLLLLLVFLTPLIGAGNFGFEGSKVFLFLSLTFLAAFIWLGKDFKWSLLNTLSGFFILSLLVTSISGLDPRTSFLGGEPYFQGFIFYSFLYLFSLLISSADISLKKWAKILSLSAAVVGILSIRQWVDLNILGSFIPTYAGRVVSSFGQPNFYAGFLVFCLPFWHFLVSNSKNKIFWVIVGAILVFAIIISESRIALGITFILLVWFFIKDFLTTKWLLVTVLILSLGTGVIAGMFSQGIWRAEVIKPANQQWLIDNSPEKRVYIWPIIADLISQKPILGYGLENMSLAYREYFQKIDFKAVKTPVYYSLKDLNVDRAHNYHLDLLFFSGFLGFISWIFLVGYLLKRARGVMLTSLLVYLIWTLFQNQSVVQLIYFWFLVGLVDYVHEN